jgi:hypothetical protein
MVRAESKEITPFAFEHFLSTQPLLSNLAFAVVHRLKIARLR